MQRTITNFLKVELALTLLMIATWGAIASKAAVEVLLFFTIDTYQWTPDFTNSKNKLRTHLGCVDEPTTVCIRSYAEKSAAALQEIEAGFMNGMPALYRFPFNTYGAAIATIFGGVTLIIGLIASHTKVRSHVASAKALADKHPRIEAYIQAIRPICAPAEIAVTSILKREPFTFRRTIFIPLSFYHDFRVNENKIGHTQHHALAHERAHAVELFPYELIFKALHIACIVFFLVLLAPIGVGLLIAPLAYPSLAFTYSRRQRITEYLANTLADYRVIPSRNAKNTKFLKTFFINRIYLFTTSAVGVFLLFQTSKSSYTGTYYMETTFIGITLSILFVLSILLMQRINRLSNSDFGSSFLK
jgi:hypothetical protein